MASSELAAWLRLTLIPGIGNTAQRRLLQALGSPEAVFAADSQALARIVSPNQSTALLDWDCEKLITASLQWTTQSDQRIVTLADPEYPQALLNIPDPPLLLYAKGTLKFLNLPAIAIVGSRNATRQGIADAEAFAKSLTDAGLTVISGMALGIDAAAHRGALAAQGNTIAVIGTGADRIYPRSNQDLARQIAQRGLLLSEFPLGTPALASNFPRRNRLIAGLARGCLVIEAAEKSGSLITARLAAEAGREVFAIPGSIHSPLSKGCNKLIQQGAKLVQTAEDILDEISWESRSKRPLTDHRLTEADNDGYCPTEDETVILDVLSDNQADLEAICHRSRLSPPDALAALLTLELAGKILSLPGGRYSLVK